MTTAKTASGSSRCSGHCCERFHLPYSYAELQENADIAWAHPNSDAVKVAEMVIYIEPDTAPDGKTYSHSYTCKYFKDGNCTNYENRPEMCRRYPYGRTCEFEACTWHPDDALRATGRVGDRPLRLFSDPIDILQELLARVRDRRTHASHVRILG